MRKKYLFFFTKSEVKFVENKVLPGSLYRCPDCLKVALFKKHTSHQYDPDWRITEEAAKEWLEKTGEYVDGES